MLSAREKQIVSLAAETIAKPYAETLQEGVDAVRAIVAAWEGGDLAAAVNAAEAWAKEAEAMV